MNHLLHIPGLIHVLQTINRERLALAVQNRPPHPEHSAAERLIETLFQPSLTLAVYGTLAPGAINAGVMATMAGTWQPGQVRGHRYENSAGAARGYPGMVWDMAVFPQPIQLFRSAELPQHWLRLDEFEGDGYVRILVPVEMPETMAVEGLGATAIRLLAIANLYALRPASVPK